ncbi:enoyl-CoA hydratase/isomerase family protein [Halolamina sp. CBA1230]|uniref:enoyl-CoA hydratase/isomerase family protein n=1 Tax=Halolamina sp. CBA1230 TaxID=1853690 RepID=UPI0009A1BF0E|nr:enoyl-CoA hydratase/isomerase family protein [Halolamina sp. CBA1230]QKY21127.1 enoyl-CoA hydratase/isomerase family protein [Halolamina sp. CBA1230]
MPEYGPYRHLDVTVEDGLATLTIDRPGTHNALNTAAMHDIDRAFAEIGSDRSVDAVVIEGAGEAAFSAGADLAEYAGPTEEHDPTQRERQERFHEIFRAPHDCHAPVIAKIDGFCVGGGLVLALYCDLRIASERSTFGLPTAAVGLLPTGGATRRLVDAVGESTAKELVFTAERIDAARAREAGLLNGVVPAESLDERVAELVASMSEVGDEARERAKRAINAAVAAPDPAAARAREASLWWEQFESSERRERVDAFLDG